MTTPRRKIWLLSLLALSALGSTAALAEDCSTAGDNFNADIDKYKNLRENASDEDKAVYNRNIANLLQQQMDAQHACEANNRSDQAKQNKIAKDRAACDKNRATYPDAYSWDSQKNKCINKADIASSKSLPESDDCSSASVFAGDLKGQNCKKALAVVKDTRSRTSAITDATTAATTAYSGLQATGATGAQDDAQTRQANIMKTLAFSKFATGLVNLVGVAQLKDAANQAESASSTISGAQKNIQAACANADDDQACFYQNAPKFGIPSDQRSYASYDRMRRGAQQSQDQADAANALAKTSMITGAADMLTGIQAMQAAQLANNNAQAFAPPPAIAAPTPTITRFGDGMGGPTAPSLAPAASTAPVDYGNPKNDGGAFGNPRHGDMAGGMMAGKMGTPNIFKSAASGVSGGGGGGASAGGGSLRSGAGSGGRRGRNSKSGTGVGEINLAGGGKGGGSTGASEKADPNNPLSDMLAKLFPQDQNGKTVVDARQIASAGMSAPEEPEQSDTVAATDLTIFDQISAKYRQLNGDGRF